MKFKYALIAGAAALLVAPISTPAQSTADLRAAALCNELNSSAFAGNIDRAIDLTYQPMVRAIGRQRMADLLRSAIDGSATVRPLEISCKPPSEKSKVGKQTFALVPTEVLVIIDGQKYRHPQHYLGVSEDDGKNWTFLHVGKRLTQESVRLIFPKGIGSITLPEPQPPVPLPNS